MKKKMLSALLAVLIFLGSLSMISTVFASAASDDGEKTEEEIIQERVLGYLTTNYKTPEEKLATMTKKLDKNGYQLYVLPDTGEIAFVDKASGQITFSNPWNIGSAKASTSTKKEIMSQIFINYTANGQTATFNSFTEAAERGQILVKNIKNGVRVEYTIGREETRILVPRLITKARFEKEIAGPVLEGMIADGIVTPKPEHTLEYLLYSGKHPMETFYYNKFLVLFELKDPNAEGITEEGQRIIYDTWPATRKLGAIFATNVTATTNELRSLESTIKKYCSDYSYEELDKDHLECQYEGTDVAPPLFKLALEYTIDDWGLIVTLPASGLRFNESLYQVNKIDVLPYMGAGTNPNSGYNFFPDGSGALFNYEKLNTNQRVTISGKVYGQDFAYHTITGTHQEIVRYPVFGLVEDYNYGEVVAEDGTTSKKVVSSGLLAIIEEGDALATLTTYHGGSTSPYNTVMMSFEPRPKDTYSLSGSLNVGANDGWEVVSKRKYVGNYTVRYIMMTDQNIAKEKGLKDTYEPTWVGMAKAYSDYLESKNVLKRLTAEDVGEDMPLFIETFGTFETLEKILSVPVYVMTPLTSFEDIKTMYNELSEEGVSNVNFKLTGYANGGIYSSIPSKLKWEKTVGGNKGFEDLVSYSEEKGFGIFPDFDFAFVYNSENSLFDALNLKKHAVKTIDNRYTTKREYSATYQSYISYYELAISPAYYMYFYNKLNENYSKYTTAGISVGSVGQYLISDFDEDEPYNREDNKEYTVRLLDNISKDYNKVMTDCGNAYSWSYVDYILNVPISSSRYIKSSNAVPFMGVVLHGFVQFAGTPTNMEGNISYAFLKAIESGSSLYFKLVYQNAEKLKEDAELQANYSVRYDIWKDDLVIMYKQLNGLMKDVQLSTIVEHKFLTGERVPDADEKLDDEKNAAEKEKAEAEAAAKAEAEKLMQDILSGKNNSLKYALADFEALSSLVSTIVAAEEGTYAKILSAIATIEAENAKLETAVALEMALAAAIAAGDAAEVARLEAELVTNGTSEEIAANIAKAEGTIREQFNMSFFAYDALPAYVYNLNNYYRCANLAAEYYTVANGFTAALEASTKENAATVKATLDQAVVAFQNAYTTMVDIFAKADAYVYEEGTPESEKRTLVTYEDYVAEQERIEAEKEAAKKEEEEKKKAEEINRYTENSGNIILIRYENGKTFILNYNVFAVTVKIDGVTYTVDACAFNEETRTFSGYLVIEEGGAN